MTDVEKADRITAVCLLYTEAEIDATELVMIVEHITGSTEGGSGCSECGHEYGHKDNCGQR